MNRSLNFVIEGRLLNRLKFAQYPMCCQILKCWAYLGKETLNTMFKLCASKKLTFALCFLFGWS